MKKLTVEGRFLRWETGEPFFYLGDTAWELFHRLSADELEVYFSTRAAQGFTVSQCVALAEFEGLTVPNAHGRLPFHFTDGLPDPTKPDVGGEYSYWDHVDKALDAAAAHGMLIALLPTWGDKINLCWGKGPVVFDEGNAYVYGKWIAERYRDRWNLIWILGGDRPIENAHRQVLDAMARGIREVDPNHLITFHPPGAKDSTDFLLDAEYVDFHTAQTGHGIEQCYKSDAVMRKMAAASGKPYLDSEPRYEDHPACFNDRIGWFWDEADVRQNAYWDVLAGACGHTYGNHCIWSMTTEPSTYFPYPWREALTHPGARQMGYVRKLRLSRDYFSLKPAPELIERDYPGMGHMAAARGEGYAYVYSPLGVPFEMALGLFPEAKAVRALWFDPRTGAERVFAILPPEGRNLFAPPTQGKGCDWVLILESV